MYTRVSMHEKTLTRKTIFEGKLVSLEVQDVELEDGRRAYREFVRHAPAVGVVARLADGRFLFVRQFRKAVEKLMTEIPAGICEPGEAAEETARRELREETGFEARTLKKLGRIYPTPGYVDEVIDIFLADLPAQAGERKLDGDERLELVTMTEAAVETSIREGGIEDAKTLAAWMLYRVGGT
jgi:ADP-ribose pyrophosphatase